MNITKSNEDYLEAILSCEKDGACKSVDIANMLGISKPAVSMAMNEMISKGLVTKQAYGKITLTEKGRAIATKTYNKHELIKRFLIGIGAKEQNAEEECCKIEHILSDDTLDCLAGFCDENGF
ncbi:MAG: metal-dependent transcriptional regulator [Clostridia bacterium]|nr:metal-dependent transcriptional regulator [Clostridia bacterium]